MTTAVYSPRIMTRQVLAREAPTGSFPSGGDSNDASSLHQRHHFAQPSVISPLSLPAPVRTPFTSTLDPVWQEEPIPITTAGASTTPAIAPIPTNRRPTSRSSFLAAPTSASPFSPSTEPVRAARSAAPIGARYRSVSANPASRIRYYSGPRQASAHAGGRAPLVASPPPSISNRSSTSADRARLLEMEAERVSWEAEKAGYLRHIEVLESKLKEAIMEKEDLQDRLDDVIADMEPGFEEDDTVHMECHNLMAPKHSSALGRGRALPQTSTFVPHDSIPGAIHTKTSTLDKTVVEAQVDSVTSPGGTQTAETTVSATVIYSAKQSRPAEEPDVNEILDVSTINPELEGIRLKAAAVQRPTFAISQASPPLSQSNSDTGIVLGPENVESAGTGSTPRHDAGFAVRKSSKAQTLHVLATAESGRRRMHAGHTPSHSVAHFPLPVAEEVAEAAIGAAHEAAQKLAVKERNERRREDYGDEGIQYEPGDDKPLKGHLMAQSDGTPDAFLDEFTKKLESISSGAEDGVPAVLRNPRLPPNEAVAAIESDVVGGTDDHVEGETEVEVDTEADIPLKLKTSTNFGLPWGQLRRSSQRAGLHAING